MMALAHASHGTIRTDDDVDNMVVLTLSKWAIRNTPLFVWGHVFGQCQVSSESTYLLTFQRSFVASCWSFYPPFPPGGGGGYLIFLLCLFSIKFILPQTLFQSLFSLCFLIMMVHLGNRSINWRACVCSEDSK